MIPGHKIEVRGSENNANIVFYQTNPANSYKTNGIRHFYPSQTPPVLSPFRTAKPARPPARPIDCDVTTSSLQARKFPALQEFRERETRHELIRFLSPLPLHHHQLCGLWKGQGAQQRAYETVDGRIWRLSQSRQQGTVSLPPPCKTWPSL